MDTLAGMNPTVIIDDEQPTEYEFNKEGIPEVIEPVYLPKGPPRSFNAIHRSLVARGEHLQLIARTKSHSKGSKEYSKLRTIRRPFVNTRQNPVGYFA